MTSRPPPPPESEDAKAGADESPMAKFRKLAKGVLSVSPDRVREEQAKYDDEEDRKRRPPLKAS